MTWREQRNVRLIPGGTTIRTAVIVAVASFIAIVSLTHAENSSLSPMAQGQPALEKIEADRLMTLGIQQFQQQQTDLAFQSWQKALALYRQMQDQVGVENALGNLAYASNLLGNFTQAIAYQQQRLETARQRQDLAVVENALGNIGNAYYDLGDYTQAIAHYQQSLAIARSLQNRRGESYGLFGLGLAHYGLGEYQQAIANYQQSLAIAQETQDRQTEGKLLDNLGLVYNAIGQYAQAIDFHQRSLAIARIVQDRRSEGKTLGNLGITYFHLGNYAKALEYQQQSLTLKRLVRDRLGEQRSLTYLGIAHQVSGNFHKALEYYQQSLALARQMQDQRGEAQALANLGITYATLANFPLAISAYQQSLAISRRIQYRQGEAAALGGLGNVYSDQGDYAQAIAHLQQQVKLSQQIKHRWGEARSLNNLGWVFFKAGKLPEAEAMLFRAIAVYESLRRQLEDSERVSLAETQRQAYRDLQQVLVAQGKAEQALEVAERGRARAFVHLLTSRLRSSGGHSAIDLLTSQAASLDLAQIRQVARTQQATIVAYSVVSPANLLIWVISPQGKVTLRQVDLQPLQTQNLPLDRLVALARCLGDPSCEQSISEQPLDSRSIGLRQTRGLIFQPDLVSRTIEPTPPPAVLQNPYLQQLHRLLIEPIVPLLPVDPNAEVVFIPQDSLFLVPFAALQDKTGKTLIERHTLRLAPAIQVLQLTQQQQARVRQARFTEALVVGNPKMPSLPPAPGEPPVPLSSLPGAQQEAEAIAPLLGTQALVGEQATKAIVVERMARSRIIHLATHGKANDQQGLQSWIAFSPSGQDSGFLTADEILNFNLNAELVVLSACETGEGQITGDGVIGLSRSIISAGAASVLVSLWAVPDAPTAFLMTEFYRNLRQNPNKAIALRQAILATQKGHPDPIAWAAFVLIGEAE